MRIELKNRPKNLENELSRLAPWGHYFKFDDRTITGFYTKIIPPEEVALKPGMTFCTSHDSPDKISSFNDAYDAMITNSKRQFMLIDILQKLMGNDYKEATAYDFGCNDGMKTFYFKKSGVKHAIGFEYREDCVERANYINEISDSGCKFIHYPISADSPEYAANLEPAEIVASFGILHHIIEHRQHIECLFRVTKQVLVLHTAFTDKKHMNEIFSEENTENSFKSVTGERALTTKQEIVNMLYDVGFSYVLDIRDHHSIDKGGFSQFMAYLIAVV